MPYKIVRNDITKMQVDVIVNTANRAPIYSTGTDTAVYLAAGEEELLAKRKEIGYLEYGEAAITPGFKLPAKYIIHAVSPMYIDGESGEEELLRSCYRKSLELAYEYQCKSIAFPLIATGGFGYPKEEGMRIALDEISAFLLQHEMLIYLVVFDNASTRLGMSIYPKLEEYIDYNYVCDKRQEEYGDRFYGSAGRPIERAIPWTMNTAPMMSMEPSMRVEPPKRVAPTQNLELQKSIAQPKKSASPTNVGMSLYETSSLADNYKEEVHHGDACEEAHEEVAYDEDLVLENESALKERIKHMSDTFQQYLMYLIETKHLTNAEVYKRAIITKQLFSKIKLNPEYHPDKSTAMRLCVGAKLNLDETNDLLARAGYALSPCDKRDIIFSFFIERKVHDMIEIDIALEEHGLPCFIE